MTTNIAGRWYPIDTAPTDRNVMCYVPGGIWGNQNPYLVCEYSQVSPHYEAGWWTVDDVCSVFPTHWCEMVPPSAEGRDSDEVDTPLAELIERAMDKFNALSPDEQASHRKAQAESWVRGEMAMNESATFRKPT
jgi:hypothetical protein